MAGITIKGGTTDCFVWTGAADTAATAVDRMGNLTEIGENSETIAEDDVTDLDSAGVETEPGDSDFGSMPMTMNLLNMTQYEKLQTIKKAKENVNIAIVVKDKAGSPVYNEQTRGWISGLSRPSITRGGILQCTVTFRLVVETVNDFTAPGEIVEVTGINVTGAGSAIIIDTNGGTLQMSAAVTPAEAEQDVVWSVTPGTGTATISEGGLLTATGNGTITVVATATDGSGVTGSLEITISNQE